MSVYVIRCRETGLFKIGHGKDPEARLADLQIGSASLLELVVALKGSHADEQGLHAKYAMGAAG